MVKQRLCADGPPEQIKGLSSSCPHGLESKLFLQPEECKHVLVPAHRLANELGTVAQMADLGLAILMNQAVRLDCVAWASTDLPPDPVGVATTKEVFGRSFREIFLVCLHGAVHRGLDGDVAGLEVEDEAVPQGLVAGVDAQHDDMGLHDGVDLNHPIDDGDISFMWMSLAFYIYSGVERGVNDF